MNRIFGSSKPQQPKATLNDAITKSDERIKQNQLKIQALDNDLIKLKEQLKKTPNNSALKQRCLRLLKQRKLYEGQQDQLYKQNFNMEQANLTVDNLKNTIITVDAMKTTSKIMKQQYKQLNIDKIDDMQADLEDQMEMANELQEIMGRYSC